MNFSISLKDYLCNSFDDDFRLLSFDPCEDSPRDGWDIFRNEVFRRPPDELVIPSRERFEEFGILYPNNAEFSKRGILEKIEEFYREHGFNFFNQQWHQGDSDENTGEITGSVSRLLLDDQEELSQIEVTFGETYLTVLRTGTLDPQKVEVLQIEPRTSSDPHLEEIIPTHRNVIFNGGNVELIFVANVDNLEPWLEVSGAALSQAQISVINPRGIAVAGFEKESGEKTVIVALYEKEGSFKGWEIPEFGRLIVGGRRYGIQQTLD